MHRGVKFIVAARLNDYRLIEKGIAPTPGYSATSTIYSRAKSLGLGCFPIPWVTSERIREISNRVLVLKYSEG